MSHKSHTATTRKSTATMTQPHEHSTSTYEQDHMVSHDEIANRAYELYAQSGFQPGREIEFWLEAERELKNGVKV